MKTYKKQRYIFFWASIVCYFVPYIAATAALLPFMTESTGMKWGIGLAVVLINSLPFLGGVLRNIFSHVPFINMISIVFLLLAGFFLMEVFRDYVYTFMTIEACAFGGSVAACVFWGLHQKYKRQAQTVSTVLKSGVLGGNP